VCLYLCILILPWRRLSRFCKNPAQQGVHNS
jgi:hypothetical protein